MALEIITKTGTFSLKDSDKITDSVISQSECAHGKLPHSKHNNYSFKDVMSYNKCIQNDKIF